MIFIELFNGEGLLNVEKYSFIKIVWYYIWILYVYRFFIFLVYVFVFSCEISMYVVCNYVFIILFGKLYVIYVLLFLKKKNVFLKILFSKECL